VVLADCVVSIVSSCYGIAQVERSYVMVKPDGVQRGLVTLFSLAVSIFLCSYLHSDEANSCLEECDNVLLLLTSIALKRMLGRRA